MIVVCPGAAGELWAFLADMLRRGRQNTMESQPASGGEVTGLAGEGLGGAMAGRAESAARQAEPVLGGVAVGPAGEGLGSVMAGRARTAARLVEITTLHDGGGQRSLLAGRAPMGVGNALEGRLGSAAVSGGIRAKLGTEAARWAR